MRYFKLNEFKSERLSLLFFNGSAMMPFDKTSSLIKFFSNFDVNIVSIELPGHGKSNFDRILNLEEYLTIFSEELNEIIDTLEEYAIIGFSIGGLLPLKLLERGVIAPKFTFVFGTGVYLDDIALKKIHTFFSAEFFEKKKWTEAMKKFHGIGWDNLLLTLSAIINKNILSNVECIANKNVFFFLGRQEQPFPPENNFPLLNGNSHQTYMIEDCTHFDYFLSAWKRTEQKIIQAIKTIPEIQYAKTIY